VLEAPVASRRNWTTYVRVGDAFALACVLFVLPMLLPLQRWFPAWRRFGLGTQHPLTHRP
jgi:hypothetical protein